MREITLNRQKLGLEDLLFGVGIVTQIRAGQNVDVTRINAGNLPFDETQTLLEWAQSINLDALSSMTTELQAIYDNLTTIGNIEDNLTVINTFEDNLVALQSLYTNISKLQNIDTNMSKLQNIDTNMSKLQNIYTNMSKLQAIYTDLTKLESIYSNLTMLTAIYSNLTALNNINSQVIPNLTELLLVNDNAAQVAADKLTVTTDKGIVAEYKDDVSAMKVTVETIYDTFDDRFLGVKTADPLVDNDGNILQDGAMYFNSSSHSLKVYGLVTLTWYTIPQIYLSGLLDVTLISVTTGDMLTWNGTKWTNTRTPSFDSVKLNGGTGTQGTATWNNTDLTYDLQLNTNVSLQVGQEELVLCKNNTASLITNGRPVMAVGTNGNSGNILIGLHDGTKASAKRIVGIATEDIAANTTGFVTRNGKVRGLNTTGSVYGETWLDGDILYVKATGALTNVEPLYTDLKMPIAFVIHAHSNGTLYVRTTGIDENHDKAELALKAPLASPALTGAPTAPTAPVATNSTQIATTAYVASKVANTAVGLNGNQTVDGIKTFSSNIVGNITGNAGSATNASNLGGNAPGYYQQALGFTPIQQGGGVGQSTSKIYIGWQGPYLRCQIDGTDFGTTFPMNITGNAGTATKLSTTRANYKDITDSVVAGELMWKKFGNSHTIIDASNATAPNGTAINAANSSFPWAPTHPTLMGWNGGQTYGVRVDSARVADSTTYAAAFTTAVGSAPSYACRAWVNFNGTGTVAIRASGNVSSITDNGVGDYTVNFTTAMPDANYSVSGLTNKEADGHAISMNTILASSLRFLTPVDSGNAYPLLDSSVVNINVIR